MIHILIVTDWPLFRIGIHSTLEKEENFAIIGETTCKDDALEIVNSQHPDVVLLDGGSTTFDPFDIALGIHQNSSWHGGLFVFAPSEEEEDLFNFIKLGAVAYEKRSITTEDLVEKINRIHHGEYIISSSMLQSSLATHYERNLPPTKMNWNDSEDKTVPASAIPLSTRELEILTQMARGHSNKSIAVTLKISDQTVKNHITSILKKLDVNDRTAAVVHALRERWINLNELGSSKEDEE